MNTFIYRFHSTRNKLFIFTRRHHIYVFPISAILETSALKFSLKSPLQFDTQFIHTSPIISYAYSESLNLVASGDQHGNLALWCATTGIIKATINLCAGISTIAFLPGSLVILCGMYENQLQQVSIQNLGANAFRSKFNIVIQKLSPKKRPRCSLEIMNILIGHQTDIYSLLAFSRDCFVSGSGDSNIIVWKDNLPTFLLEGHSETVTCLVLCGDSLFSSSLDKFIIGTI